MLELEISRDLGVSRTPIREALKVLASEGLVDLLPLRGAVVKTFSPKDASDMLEVMALLESFAAQKACKADQKKIDRVLSMHEKMKLLYDKGKRSEYFERFSNWRSGDAQIPADFKLQHPLTWFYFSFNNQIAQAGGDLKVQGSSGNGVVGGHGFHVSRTNKTDCSGRVMLGSVITGYRLMEQT